MTPQIIIPADVVKNLIENIQRYFEIDAEDDSDIQSAIDYLDAVQHTFHDILVVSGADSMYDDGMWLDNPHYINFKDQMTAGDSTAQDQTSED